MSDLNVIVLKGRLVADADHKVTSGGSSLTTARIAVNRWIPGKNGSDGREKTSYFSLALWGGLADHYGSKLTKGARLIVHGSMEQSEWEDSEGKKRSDYEIRVDSLDLIDRRTDTNDESPPSF